MKTTTWHRASVLLLTVPLSACTPDSAVLQGPTAVAASASPLGVAESQPIQASAGGAFLAAGGTITQTAITGFELRLAGPNTIIQQTTEGSFSGTFSGTLEDSFTVVIRPDGRFSLHGTITCECTVEGKHGVVELVVVDTGELVSPDSGTFKGRVVIKRGTGELSGLHGVLEMEGTVDVPSGLSVATYSGQIHFRP